MKRLTRFIKGLFSEYQYSHELRKDYFAVYKDKITGLYGLCENGNPQNVYLPFDYSDIQQHHQYIWAVVTLPSGELQVFDVDNKELITPYLLFSRIEQIKPSSEYRWHLNTKVAQSTLFLLASNDDDNGCLVVCKKDFNKNAYTVYPLTFNPFFRDGVESKSCMANGNLLIQETAHNHNYYIPIPYSNTFANCSVLSNRTIYLNTNKQRHDYESTLVLDTVSFLAVCFFTEKEKEQHRQMFSMLEMNKRIGVNNHHLHLSLSKYTLQKPTHLLIVRNNRIVLQQEYKRERDAPIFTTLSEKELLSIFQ